MKEWSQPRVQKIDIILTEQGNSDGNCCNGYGNGGGNVTPNEGGGFCGPGNNNGNGGGTGNSNH